MSTASSSSPRYHSDICLVFKVEIARNSSDLLVFMVFFSYLKKYETPNKMMIAMVAKKPIR